MNKITKNIVCAGLCAALCLGGVGTIFAVNADSTNKAGNVSVSESESTTESESVKETKISAENEDGAFKEETVYAMAEADGTVSQIIVSDWISNPEGLNEVEDISELTDIENVKNDDTFSVKDNNTKVWNVQGKDVYYKGNSNKELPIKMTITYMLDGKKISAQELTGKSGKVTIRFDYENCQYEEVQINGKTEKMYVPFTVLTGMLLDNNKFTNVEVSNGKIINDGDHLAAVGFAFPGLASDLSVVEDKIDIPEYVEVTADVEDFAIGMTATIVTNDLFNEFDASKIEDETDMKDELNKLTDGMNQLLDGSSKLYDGLSKLLEKSDELVDGMGQLADGAYKVKNGAAAVNDGTAQLEAGIDSLSDGLSQLSSNSETLNDGAKQVFDTLLSTATAQLTAAGIAVPDLTIDNYSAVLGGVIDSLSDSNVYQQALAEVTAQVEANSADIENGVTAAVKSEVTTGVKAIVQQQVQQEIEQTVRAGLAAQGLDEEAIAAQMETEEMKARISAELATKMESAEVGNLVEQKVEEKMATDEIKEKIAVNVELMKQQLISQNMASDAVKAKLSAAAAGAETVADLLSSLNSYNGFYCGLLQYTGSVDSAAVGAATINSLIPGLKSGTEQLSGGASDLYDGVILINDKMPDLIDGVTQLKDGSMQLSDGLKKFNEDGVEKIVDLVDGDLAELTDRLDAMSKVSKNYKNYSGISSSMNGSVKFIYKTSEIK